MKMSGVYSFGLVMTSEQLGIPVKAGKVYDEILGIKNDEDRFDASPKQFNCKELVRVFPDYLIPKSDHELISAYNDYIQEYYSIGDIRPLMRQDVTSPYFVKWLFKTDEFSDDEPEKFDFNILIDDPERGNHVYGYYVNNLEGIIRIRDNKTFKSISMLFVNPDSEGNGIGQTLLRYAIKKYGDDDLKLNVFTFNKRAIHIYEKYGFKITDTHTVQEEPGESDKFVGKKMHAMTRYPSKNGIRPLEKRMLSTNI